MTLVVSSLKTALGEVKVGIREEVSAKIIKICYPLTCGIELQWWRVLSDIRDELIRQSRFPALRDHSALFHGSIGGHHTWKKSFKARFANEYIPTFFPSGFPSDPTPFLFVVLSVKQTVKARCIVSAVPSTKVFRVSPASTSATLRNLRVRSGLLSSVIASFARAVDSWMAVGSITIPYVGLDKAAKHVLFPSH